MHLPIDDVLPDLRAALAVSNAAVLVAPPGAGKTTRAPLALLGEPWVGQGRILVLSPRRVAARATAERMARALGEPVGRTVGYRVRLESRTSAATRIEVVTEGVFTRMILSDPALGGVAAVLFDEFHERSLEGDLGLALALDVQGALREDLRILVMSATLDGARVASLMGDAPQVVSEGRLYPVDVRYLGRDVRTPVEQAMAEAVISALGAERGGILAFLPGAGEIERTAARLQGRVGEAAIQPLYGALDPRIQDAAISPVGPDGRKVVLATSIAETSLTIEGVRVVIDSGLSRRPKFEPDTGLTRLVTVRASRAAVEQRKGRAGRTEPGVCWRLWGEGETRALAPFDRPEILEADLAGLVLDLAAWGVRDPSALRWMDPPPVPAWREAEALLRDLGALDASGRLTPEGSAIATLPLQPRLAHMVARAARYGEGLGASMLAMVISEPGLVGRDADLRHRLGQFMLDRTPRASSARRAAEAIARRAGGPTADAQPALAGAMLLHAYPERVARARGRRGEFLMACGRAAALPETDALAREAFLAIAEVAGPADRTAIISAAPVTRAEIDKAFGDSLVTDDDVSFDAQAGAVRARRLTRLGRLVIQEAPLEKPDAARVRAVLADAVLRDGLQSLPWRDDVRQWRARIALMRRLEGDPWPDVTDAGLVARAGEWLDAALGEASRLDAIEPEAIAQALRLLLPHDLARRLDREAPARYRSPAEGEHAIDYAAESGPALDVRLQELFGLAQHPAVAGGRALLLLRLLSPAGRPVQTTRDLPGFWAGSYAAVRSEMKGRYPKHPWPDDPLKAPPTRRAKPRG
ncbi:MAG: ATP-dependent helicase HrpB [Hyphomonadaceae bacterium]|nr:ATP-dependent helicase HrpB [Hyphomonadaceae bacterium]